MDRWFDRGLQPERTALSWQRTGLSAASVSIVTAFIAVRVGFSAVAIAAVLVATATVALALSRFPRARVHVSGLTDPWPVLVRVGVIVVAAAVLGALVPSYSFVSSLLSSAGVQ